MENRPLAEYTMPELCEALRIAKEGRDNEMSPERACQYHARCVMICNEIAARNYKDCTIEIDKSIDKSIDLDPPVSRWDRFWQGYGGNVFTFCSIVAVLLVLKYLL